MINDYLNSILIKCAESIGTSSVYWQKRKEGCGYVYFLFQDEDLVYIGQSSNGNRIGQHQKTKDFNRVKYLACENYEHIEIEVYLIRTIPTKYNKDRYAHSAQKSASGYFNNLKR